MVYGLSILITTDHIPYEKMKYIIKYKNKETLKKRKDKKLLGFI